MAPDHYFTNDPSVESDPQPVGIRLPDVSLDLMSDRGTFSVGALDRGTEFLLRAAPDPPAIGDILDLGCGWGPIASVIARRSPSATVWAIDINERALGLTASNATRLGLGNVRAVKPEDVPDDVRFAAIYSNPPVRVGKSSLHEMLTTWLERLTPDGYAVIVIHRHLGGDSLQEWLIEQGYLAERLRSRQGYRLFDVRRPAA